MACISRGRNTKQEVLVLGSRGCISYGGGLGIGHWGLQMVCSVLGLFVGVIV